MYIHLHPYIALHQQVVHKLRESWDKAGGESGVGCGGRHLNLAVVAGDGAAQQVVRGAGRGGNNLVTVGGHQARPGLRPL